MTKKELRKIYLAKRLELTDADYEDLNQKLLTQFKKISFSDVQYLHIYLPIKARKEPDTLLLIEWLKTHHPQITLVYPKVDFANTTMQGFLDDDKLVLAINEYGIPEPVSGNVVNNADIDMVVVPLLAFDSLGYRVGYGKGFYDRFMVTCKPGVRFIGLSFFEPVNAIDDVDDYDVALHQCIAPDKLWAFVG